MAALSVLVFELRGRRCALPVSAAREVFALGAVTPVPTAPPVVRGLVPLRGQVLPLLDLGVYLAPAGEPPGRSADNAVLVEWSDDTQPDAAPIKAALLVDRVLALDGVDDDAARAVPGAPDFAPFAVGGAAGPTLLVDPGRAFARVRASVEETGRSA